MIDRIRKNAFARNSIVLFVGSTVANFLGYAFHLAVGRMASVEVFGEIESLLSLITIITVPSAILTMIATKYSAGYKADNDKVKNYNFFILSNKKVFILTAPIFLISILFIPYIKEFLSISEIGPLALVWGILFFASFASIANGMLTGWQGFRQIGYANIWGGLVKLISVIIFIKSGLVLGGAVGSFLLGLLTTYAITLYFLKSFFEKDKSEKNNNGRIFQFSSVRNYVLPVILGNIAFAILGNVDMVLAKHNLDPQVAGQFGALTIVSKIIYMVTIIVSTVLFSMSAENNHKKNSSVSILKMACVAMTVISLGAIIFYFSFPEFVLGIFFGGKYNDVAHFLGWFSILVALFSFANLFFQYFLSIHETKIVYGFLTLAILEIPAVLFVGKSISAILMIVITFQALAVLISLFFLKKANKSVA